MKIKNTLLFALTIATLSVSSLLTADTNNVQKSNNFTGSMLTLEDQFKVLCDYSATFNAQGKATGGNEINFIGIETEKDRIDVSLVNPHDAAAKYNILSLPGIDRNAINFIEFKIAWYGFRTVTPAGK